MEALANNGNYAFFLALFIELEAFVFLSSIRLSNGIPLFKMSVLLTKIVLQMLVVFKSAPILKRVLKVKHELLQLYVLKVSLFHVIDSSKGNYKIIESYARSHRWKYVNTVVTF